MSFLLIISHNPYDGSDVAWNALRLADAALDRGVDVRLFLINDGVDIARPECQPEGAEFDLTAMLRDLIERGAAVKLCHTCLQRCGVGRGETVQEAEIAGMADLVQWIIDSDKMLTF